MTVVINVDKPLNFLVVIKDTKMAHLGVEKTNGAVVLWDFDTDNKLSEREAADAIVIQG